MICHIFVDFYFNLCLEIGGCKTVVESEPAFLKFRNAYELQEILVKALFSSERIIQFTIQF